MKKTICLLITILFLGANTAFSQEEHLKTVGDIIPPSPNAASLGIYGAIPVSHYTGTPNISIPIYEINLDGKKIPISLSYHASGIKVNQEASWVGLGWSLNAGGIITRQVQDGIDFGPQTSDGTRFGYYYATRLPSYFDYGYNFSGVPNFSDFLYDTQYTDTEPDLYTYNFNSHSGVMITGHMSTPGNSNTLARGILRQPKEYLDIQYNIQNNHWVAHDGNGYTYYFKTEETSRTYTQTASSKAKANEYQTKESLNKSFVYPQNTTFPHIPPTSSWLLDSIVSPSNNKIVYSYKMEEIETVISYSENLRKSLGMWGVGLPSGYTPGTTQQYSYTIIKQAILEKITFDGGEITFVTSDREDLRSTKPQKPQKLERITIKDKSGQYMKNIKFSYLYHGDTKSNYTCRLLLDKIQENDLPPYQFSYNMNYLPPKHSLATDHWGYYNNSANPKHTDQDYYLNATPSIHLNDNNYTHIDGRDKFPNKDYMFNGILKSIQYPTKGKTEFYYEPHDYSEGGAGTTVEHESTNREFDIYINSEEDINAPYPVEYRDERELYSEFNLRSSLKSCVLKVQCNRAHGFDLKFPDFGLGFRLEKKNAQGEYEPIPFLLGNSYTNLWIPINQDISDNSFTYIFKPLQTGEYRLVLIKDWEINYYSLTVDMTTVGDVLNHQLNVTGGGVRIKEITNSLNGKKETKKYVYSHYGISSGFLMTAPEYYRTEMEDEPGTLYEWLGVTSESYTPFSYSAQGSPVGYSVVKELHGSATIQGYTVYEFHNEQDDIEYIFDRAVYRYPVCPSLRNGLLTKVSVYDGQDNLKTTTEYHYEKKQSNEVKGIKRYLVHYDTLLGPVGHFKLYSQRCETWKLIKEITEQYDGDSPLISQKTYNYDPVYQINNEIVKTSSTGDLYKYLYKYPFDYSTQISNKMKEKHFMEVPLEVVKLKNNQVVSGEKASYMDVSGKILPEKSYSLAATSGLTLTNYAGYFEEEKVFGNYTSNGKIGSVKGRDDVATVFLWSYHKQYPVAEIKNATYHEVQNAAQSIGLNLNTLENTLFPDIEKLNQLRQRLPGAFITTYTYKPLVGLTSLTDEKGTTTYYDYDNQGRLKESYLMKDGRKEILEAYEYNYANQ